MTDYTKHNVISAGTVARLVEEQKQKDLEETACGQCFFCANLNGCRCFHFDRARKFKKGKCGHFLFF